VKIKCIRSDSFFIVGYEPSSEAPGGISRLRLAGPQGNDLFYVGGVGYGLTPVSVKRNGVKWVQPTLAADEKLRHPSYKGLRKKRDNAVVYCIKVSST
jgi:bifunctional non-homologous end joining protein LigD